VAAVTTVAMTFDLSKSGRWGLSSLTGERLQFSRSLMDWPVAGHRQMRSDNLKLRERKET